MRYEVDVEFPCNGFTMGGVVPVEAENADDAIVKAIDKFWNEGAKFEALSKDSAIIDQVTIVRDDDEDYD